jgi:hypothetical protein
MAGRGWRNYASVGQEEGGISVVDTREKYKTRVRVVNTGMPRVKVRARREEYILIQAGIKVPRTKNTGVVRGEKKITLRVVRETHGRNAIPGE